MIVRISEIQIHQQHCRRDKPFESLVEPAAACLKPRRERNGRPGCTAYRERIVRQSAEARHARFTVYSVCQTLPLVVTARSRLSACEPG